MSTSIRKTMLKLVFNRFCMTTSLHGLRFLVIAKSTICERIFWGAVILSGLIGVAIVLPYTRYSMRKDEPLVVTDLMLNPIWKYPFPAVTICSNNKISKRKMNKLIQKLVLPTTAKPIGMQQIRLLLQLFPNVRDVELDIEDLQSLQTVLDYNNMTVQDALYNISPSCKDTVIQCKWKGDIRRCGSLFEEVITPMGICCSFNYVHKNISQKEKRLAGMGKYSGLIVTLYNDVNDYVFTDILAYGQKALIHFPYDAPGFTQRIVMLPDEVMLKISVNPTLHRVDKNLAQSLYCLARVDQNTNTFYTYGNCKIRCKVEVVIKYCNCVPVFSNIMHHNKGHLRQCRLTDVPCVSKYNNIFYDGSHVNACSCLSNCWYATYKLEISNGKLLRNDRTDYLLPPNYKNVSLLFVFFGRMFSESQMATVVNTWEELSGLYGGLLSLFAGFSCGVLLELIQTVVELIEEKSFKDAMGTSKRNKRKRSSKKRAKLTRKENRW